jgi:spore maturation protein CgeB
VANFDIVILGLSITSSWGNGHATTYRSLVSGLARRGHRILFLERNVEWYASNRDEPSPSGTAVGIYESFEELVENFERHVAGATLTIVGSFVPEGARIGEWVTSLARGRTAFYDIDTPITLAELRGGRREYITPELVRRYDGYFSFTGGPVLRAIESEFGARMARPLYCSVDPQRYRPVPPSECWHLGYLGTFSEDRQPALEELLLEPARLWPLGRFAVIGPMYPEDIDWPANVTRQIHISPREHPAFYSAQQFTLNITRAEMKRTGYSPSVRLFEAGACGVPVISDWWEGLDQFFEPETEVLIASTADDVLRILHDVPPERRRAIGRAARRQVLAKHTPERRALELESYLREMNDNSAPDTPRADGRPAESAGRLAGRLASEPPGQASGVASGPEPGGSPYSRYLHQSSRTGGGDGGTGRKPPQSVSPNTKRLGRVAPGSVGRQDV